MGIAIPRPAMRAREDRVIRTRLKWGFDREAELIAAGVPQADTRTQAYQEGPQAPLHASTLKIKQLACISHRG